MTITTRSVLRARKTGPASLIAIILFAIVGCATSPADAEGETRRIIAVGDLHGDYDAYRAIMTEAGLIDRRGRWTGGETVFVQTGDVPDRGPDSLKIIKHLMKLESQARRGGGDVVALVGNHEAMNMTGDYRYVHPGEYEAFRNSRSRSARDAVYRGNKEAIDAFYLAREPEADAARLKFLWEEATPLGKIEHNRAWAPGGEIGDWIAGHDAVAMIDGVLFAHGGLSADYLSVSLEEINEQARAALRAGETDAVSIINNERGPLWYRGLVGEGDGDEAAAAEAAQVLAAFDAAAIVVGHTPSLGGVRSIHNGLVIQIDTGIADYYGGARAFLRIEGGVLYAHQNGDFAEIGRVGR